MTSRMLIKPLALVSALAAFSALGACQKEKKKSGDSDTTGSSATSGDTANTTGAARPADPHKTPPGHPAKPAIEPIPAPPDVAAPPADAEKTASGLTHKLLQPAQEGDHPAAHDKVKVHYTGWTTDGNMFDSSVQRGRPATFGVKGVIPGWTEGLQLMKVGEKARMWIPEELAYKGKPGRPQGMLVFDVELLDIKKAPKPIPAPKDVAKPPKSAKTTESGLAYKVLSEGKGGDKPTRASMVEVHYTGWTTDGKMFDSSVARGQPAQFPLGRVIAGWTEGLQLMSVGDKYRLWIPEDLAYKGRPGKPQGMLVFDVELLSIKDAPTPHPGTPRPGLQNTKPQ